MDFLLRSIGNLRDQKFYTAEEFSVNDRFDSILTGLEDVTILKSQKERVDANIVKSVYAAMLERNSCPEYLMI